MKILYIAELVGKAGIYALKKGLPSLKETLRPDFTIVCGNGATGGGGLGRNHAAYIRKLGVDVITTGDCCFYKKDLVENIGKIPYVLRPYNLSPASPGSGERLFKAKDSKIAVAVLLGQNDSGRLSPSSPFAVFQPLLERLRNETPYVIVDFHAWASGEKRTFFAAAKGLCTAVIGSHNRVQTADEQLLRGTAVICDAGRTGSAESVGGAEITSRIREYLSGIPDWTREAWGKPEIQGVFIEADSSGRAVSIRRIKSPVEAAGAEKSHEPESA
ncbi:MAG: YmdB family metallophosphoesterase [Treponema sp.]|nr:YmdB family metallophosphoesterase [Treponema sp.]